MNNKLFIIIIAMLIMLTGCAAPSEPVISVALDNTPEPVITPVAATAIPEPASTAIPEPASTASVPTAAPATTPEAAAAPEATPTAKPSPIATPVATATPIATAEPERAADTDLGSGVLALVNSYRSAAGVSTLEYSSAMQKAANTRAKECASSFSHTRPDGSNAYTALTERGIAFTAFGENIFASSGLDSISAEYVTEQWLASPGHRENILREGYTHMCIGYAAQGDEIYVVQLFAAGLS